jgi:hypothetical protein
VHAQHAACITLRHRTVLREGEELKVHEQDARRARDVQAARGSNVLPLLILEPVQRLRGAVRRKRVLQRLHRAAANVLRKRRSACVRRQQAAMRRSPSFGTRLSSLKGSWVTLAFAPLRFTTLACTPPKMSLHGVAACGVTSSWCERDTKLELRRPTHSHSSSDGADAVAAAAGGAGAGAGATGAPPLCCCCRISSSFEARDGRVSQD